MGIISGIIAIKNVNKINNGIDAKLSIAQIANVITNMMDAKNNLSSDQFKSVYTLFRELQKSKCKIYMNKDVYLETCMELIDKFNEIAPYEKYSGFSELETLMLLRDIERYRNLNNL